MPFTNDEQIIQEKAPAYRYIVLSVSVLSFLLSLPFACFYTTRGPRMSLEALLMGGPLILAGGIAGITWLANPCLITCWILIGKNKKAAWIFGIIAAMLSLCFLTCHNVLEDEAGNVNPILRLGLGYWFWLAACIVAAIGSLLLRLTRPKPQAI